MPFPLPSPAIIARRLEARMEGALVAARPDASPVAIARAVRSPRGVVAGLIRAVATELYECHLHLAWWGRQYMPDTAEDENLERHADIWGIRRRAATTAIGRALLTGVPGTLVPALTALRSPAGALFETVEAVELIVDEIVVDVRSVEPGPEGNVAAGTRLALVSPIVGLDPQAATVDADGVAGGAPRESLASLLERTLERIQQPPHGGAAFDYPTWVKNGFAAAHVAALPAWVGLGMVGVAVAMGTRMAPRAPTAAELEAIADHLGRLNSQTGLKPVTAEVVVVPADLLVVPHEVLIDPDQPRVRAAVEAAIALFYAREARIGGTLTGLELRPWMYRSRLSEAISAAAGEYRHELIAPAGNVAVGPRQLAVPGVVTWVAP